MFGDECEGMCGVVSILVVLDWVFKPSGLSAVVVPYFCFNPCCIGLGIQTVCGGADWERPVKFQSLLYWIGYSNSRSPTVHADPMPSFNPCCIGLGIQTRNGWRYWRNIRQVSILVVLDWVFKPLLERLLLQKC